MSAPVLTTADCLEAFDRWDPVARRAGGPAYGRVVAYAAHRCSLEELVRAVLLDQGLDPERWEEHRCVVCRAFVLWMRVVYPAWTLPGSGCAGCVERAA